jgi:hypothetical protein
VWSAERGRDQRGGSDKDQQLLEPEVSRRLQHSGLLVGDAVGGGEVVFVRLGDDVDVALCGGDADAEEIAEAANVAVGGDRFMEDPVFADPLGDTPSSSLIHTYLTGMVRTAVRKVMNTCGLLVLGQRRARSASQPLMRRGRDRRAR